MFLALFHKDNLSYNIVPLDQHIRFYLIQIHLPMFYEKMNQSGRILTDDWDLYDTRHVVFQPHGMPMETLKSGYDRAYRDFYTWNAILQGSLSHGSIKHQLKHFFYTSGWKKFEPLWNLAIQLKKLNCLTRVLESVLSEVTRRASVPSQKQPRDLQEATGMVSERPC